MATGDVVDLLPFLVCVFLFPLHVTAPHLTALEASSSGCVLRHSSHCHKPRSVPISFPEKMRQSPEGCRSAAASLSPSGSFANTKGTSGNNFFESRYTQKQSR